MRADQIIELLGLKPLPQEGGFFRETHRASEALAEEALGGRHSGDRHLSTAIYFLITAEHFSAFHRIVQDEVFHFYLGDAVELVQLDEAGHLQKIGLGPKLLEGQRPQAIVPAGTWQGLRVVEGGEWALLGATVSPGFDFRDFEIGKREELLARYPQYRAEILRFTREG